MNILNKSGTQGNLPGIFISYSTKDQQIAEHVHQRLISAGFDAFLATRNIRTGDDWKIKIEDAIKNRPVMVLLWSSNCETSKWVNDELN
ncbi:MAG TPA: toll/interleukin-1 receptor domain-containing protein, partial [Anaerolineales bacterium]|nr:toll/interleukin-1 receptor domain-containing protein [Anaerolineales bacterium]